MHELGFLEDDKLTSLGRMASEINEGHCILESVFYSQSETLKNLKRPDEILTVLAVFLGEGQSQTTRIDVPRNIQDSIEEIMTIAKRCSDVEKGNRVQVPFTKGDFWEINLQWVEPIWRWVQGAELSEIITDYELFEGNFLRILSKLGNVLEEWRSLATLQNDTDMLNLLLNAESLVRMKSNDSLYLRL
jgi:superfamily II RNA helicase